jgi:hypothetical protein
MELLGITSDVMDNKRIRIEFSRDLDDPSTTSFNAFSIMVVNGGVIPNSIKSISLDALDNNVLVVEMAERLYGSDNVFVSYDEAVGNLTSADGVKVIGFAFEKVSFYGMVNLLIGSAYDYSFETTTVADNWPSLGWGGFNKYTATMSSNAAVDGALSMYIDIEAGDGCVFTHMRGGTPVMFTLEAGKTYEVGVWMMIDQMSVPDGGRFEHDFRFYTPEWKEMIFTIPDDTPIGEWVYYKQLWKVGETKEYNFKMRGYNGSSTQPLRFYMDNVSIFELEQR